MRDAPTHGCSWCFGVKAPQKCTLMGAGASHTGRDHGGFPSSIFAALSHFTRVRFFFPTPISWRVLRVGVAHISKGCGSSQGLHTFPRVVDLPKCGGSQGLCPFPRVMDLPKGHGSSQRLWVFSSVVHLPNGWQNLPNGYGSSQRLHTFPRFVHISKCCGSSQGLWSFPKVMELPKVCVLFRGWWILLRVVDVSKGCAHSQGFCTFFSIVHPPKGCA